MQMPSDKTNGIWRRWGSFLVALLAALVLVAPAAAQDFVEVTAKPQKSAVVPGDQFAIAVVFDHQEGWHINPSDPAVPPEMGKFDPIPTSIELVQSPTGARQWDIQWPAVHKIPVKLGEKPALYGVYEGRAIAYVPVAVSDAAQPGEAVSFTFEITYQPCNDTTCALDQTIRREVTIPVISLEEQARAAVVAQDPDFAGFDPTIFGKAPVGGTGARRAAKPITFDAFGIVKFSINPAGAGLILLLLAAALGGFLLNFTPCVLPVLPLKVMGISAAAGNPARCLFLGTVMSLGVIAFWMAIGLAIAFVSGFTAISSLFQTSWFAILVGLFILFMAIGMLGAYAVQLPKAVYMINPNHETVPGSFIFGVMTAVLSTPCTAPFMGSAAAWAATQNAAITLLAFGAIGFGMALPYLVLSAFPRMLSKVPRTGPASELIKQMMGLLLVAVAIFFLGTGIDPLMRSPVDPPVRFFWWIIGLIAMGAMLWLMYRTWKITRRPVVRAFWTGFAMLFAAASLAVAVHFTDRGPIPWVGYTPQRLAQNLGEQKVVVLDFTAEWCINCKALEAGVLHRPEIVALLTNPGVVPMKVDLTGNNVDGKAKLKELQWVGIPLLVIYGPNLDEPIKYDAYTPEMVREAIVRAGGVSGSTPAAGNLQAVDLAAAAQASPEAAAKR